MKYQLLILFLVVFAYQGVLKAQERYVGTVFFENVNISTNEDELQIGMELKLDHLNLRKQDLLLLTPVLHIPAQKDRQIPLAPIAITGKVRHKAVKRALRLDNYDDDATPDQLILRRNGEPQSIEIKTNIPFEEWMRQAELSFSQTLSGCKECPPCFMEYNVQFSLPEPFEPSYQVAYITPQPEPVKRRSETYQARLGYVVNRFELLRNFGNNAEVLDEADRVISEISGNSDLTVQQLRIVGYASPEGNYEKNIDLSKNRAYAFVDYLKVKHNIPQSMVEVDWKGEDWDGLRKVIAETSLPEKQEILQVIDGNEDISQRKRKLESLRGGVVYSNLLKNYYPPLRRNEYIISFIAREFDIEEARALIKTRPQYLSLNEMFLVANSYPKDSEDFKEVFDIAVRMFPHSDVARINAAAQEIESGMYDAAIKRMEQIDAPEAWNNLGVAYVLKGNNEKAEAYFMKAATAGLETAHRNNEQLKNVTK